MSLTMLTPTSDTKLKPSRVQIVADTVINRNGRGVPVWAGSVLDVTGEDAAMLFASNKAKKTTAEVKIVENPNTPKGK